MSHSPDARIPVQEHIASAVLRAGRFLVDNERLLVVAASTMIMSLSHTALRPVLPVFAKVRLPATPPSSVLLPPANVCCLQMVSNNAQLTAALYSSPALHGSLCSRHRCVPDGCYPLRRALVWGRLLWEPPSRCTPSHA